MLYNAGMAELSVKNTPATLGAVVTGARLPNLTAAQWRRLETAFHNRAVLILPGQWLTEAEQMDFGRRFGELAIEAQPLGNERADGTLRDAEDPVMRLIRGSEDWHTDSSYRRLAAKASILSAHKVPSCGGETEWADMAAAYGALGAAERTRIEGLAAYHSLHHSQSRVGQDGADLKAAIMELQANALGGTDVVDGPQEADGQGDGVPPLRPLVKRHPATGRRVLFIGRHAYGIPGLAAEESAQLLADLMAFACRPPRVLAHRWQPGDTVIWDNRRVLHRVRPWPFDEPRLMLHTRVDGDPATELAIA